MLCLSSNSLPRHCGTSISFRFLLTALCSFVALCFAAPYAAHATPLNNSWQVQSGPSWSKEPTFFSSGHLGAFNETFTEIFSWYTTTNTPVPTTAYFLVSAFAQVEYVPNGFQQKADDGVAADNRDSGDWDSRSLHHQRSQGSRLADRGSRRTES